MAPFLRFTLDANDLVELSAVRKIVVVERVCGVEVACDIQRGYVRAFVETAGFVCKCAQASSIML